MIKVLTNLKIYVVILLTCVGMIQTKSLKTLWLRSVSQEIREDFFLEFLLICTLKNWSKMYPHCEIEIFSGF